MRKTLTVNVLDRIFPGGLDYEIYDRDDPLSTYLAMGVLWHPGIVRFLYNWIKPGQIFVDIGAHIGLFSVIAAKKVGASGRVIAFEPAEDNLAILRRNAEQNGVEVDSRPIAIADRSGQMTLHRSARNRGGHSLIEDRGLESGSMVAVSTLSEQLPHIKRIDYLKLDVQGLEPSILDSISDLVASLERPPYIILEVNPKSWIDADPDFQTLKRFKRRHAFDIHGFITSEGIAARPPVIRWSTFRRICDDLIAYSNKSDELDILLYPPPISR